MEPTNQNARQLIVWFSTLLAAAFIASPVGTWLFTFPTLGSAVEFAFLAVFLVCLIAFPKAVSHHVRSFFRVRTAFLIFVSGLLFWLGSEQLGRVKEPYANARCFLIFCSFAFYFWRPFSDATFSKAVYNLSAVSMVGTYLFGEYMSELRFGESVKNAVPVGSSFLMLAIASAEPSLLRYGFAAVSTVFITALSFYRGFFFLGCVAVLGFGVVLHWRMREVGRTYSTLRIFSVAVILVIAGVLLSPVAFKKWNESESHYIQSMGKTIDVYNSVLYGDALHESESLRLQYLISLYSDIDELFVPKGFGYIPNDPRLPARVFMGGSIDSTWFYIAYHAGWLTLLLVLLVAFLFFVRHLLRLNGFDAFQWCFMWALTFCYLTLTAEALLIPWKAVVTGLWISYIYYWALCREGQLPDAFVSFHRKPRAVFKKGNREWRRISNDKPV